MIDQSLIATRSIIIQSSSEKIWNVLTDPAKIKQYLFGTNVETDWMVGSKIVFQGQYQDQQYTDKGNVIENEANRLLKYNYWSGFSGLEDVPENYSMVSYLIEAMDGNEHKFTWHQQGFSSEDGKCHTEEGLVAMLQQIKQIAEE